MGAGFLFAFYVYDGSDPTVLEAVVHGLASLMTGSVIIHVDIVPVVAVLRDGQLLLDSKSYTAYMGRRFVEHCSTRCLSPEFKLLYVPMERMRTVAGVRFLRSLVGCPYGTSKLPFAALPLFIKDGCRDERELRTVFCSEAGLLLCKICGVVATGMAASVCTPAELHDMLLDEKAVEWPLDRVRVMRAAF